jgi:hypothetical protein
VGGEHLIEEHPVEETARMESEEVICFVVPMKSLKDINLLSEEIELIFL